jgi:hypothetical protein
MSKPEERRNGMSPKIANQFARTRILNRGPNQIPTASVVNGGRAAGEGDFKLRTVDPGGDMKHEDQPLLSEREVATRWRITVSALRAWRLKRVGPRWIRLGRLVRYDVRDLAAWISKQTVKTNEN